MYLHMSGQRVPIGSSDIKLLQHLSLQSFNQILDRKKTILLLIYTCYYVVLHVHADVRADSVPSDSQD